MNVITGHQWHGPTLAVLGAIVFGPLLLVAAAAGAGGSERAHSSGASAQGEVACGPAESVQLPDLNDPAIRQRFVDSFGAGSFGLSG